MNTTSLAMGEHTQVWYVRVCGSGFVKCQLPHTHSNSNACIPLLPTLHSTDRQPRLQFQLKFFFLLSSSLISKRKNFGDMSFSFSFLQILVRRTYTHTTCCVEVKTKMGCATQLQCFETYCCVELSFPFVKGHPTWGGAAFDSAVNQINMNNNKTLHTAGAKMNLLHLFYSLAKD